MCSFSGFVWVYAVQRTFVQTVARHALNGWWTQGGRAKLVAVRGRSLNETTQQRYQILRPGASAYRVFSDVLALGTGGKNPFVWTAKLMQNFPHLLSM